MYMAEFSQAVAQKSSAKVSEKFKYAIPKAISVFFFFKLRSLWKSQELL